jgi:hypothetical protein
MRVKVLAVLGAALSVVALTGPAARASEVTVNTVKDGSILWVGASVSDPSADSITLKIYSPRDDNGRRHLWQRCHFDGVGAASYHCGIDISGSDNPTGRWVARALVDGGVADSAWFRT